jgi:uncharacterized damage-inducible protein DinB
MIELSELFLSFSLRKLKLLASRVDDCLSRLTDEQVWGRSGENANAIGNLVLHLCGNVRQWTAAGIAGETDIRQRDGEFATRQGASASELRILLSKTIEDAVAVIENITPERLVQPVRIQKYDLKVLEAVYTVVEHFAQHTGQIIFATKLLTGADLGYYAHLPKPNHSERTP